MMCFRMTLTDHYQELSMTRLLTLRLSALVFTLMLMLALVGLSGCGGDPTPTLVQPHTAVPTATQPPDAQQTVSPSATPVSKASPPPLAATETARPTATARITPSVSLK